MKVHHVGYLVKNIDKAMEKFKLLGFQCENEVIYDSIQKANIIFLINSEYRIELIEPVEQDSVTYNLLKKVGNSPYHICYICDDIYASYDLFREQGYSPITDIVEAVAIDKKKVCFMFNNSVGIIELLEL